MNKYEVDVYNDKVQLRVITSISDEDGNETNVLTYLDSLTIDQGNELAHALIVNGALARAKAVDINQGDKK